MRAPALLALLLIGNGPIVAQGLRVDAKTSDGKTVSGDLNLLSAGSFQFRSAAKAVLFDSIVSFKGPPKELVRLRAPLPAEIHLIDQQLLTGEVTSCDESKITLRAAWANSVSISRSVIERIAHAARWQPVFADSFEDENPQWKLAGKAQRREGGATSGRFGLVLDAPGQAAGLALSEHVAVGKIGVNLHVRGVAKGRRCTVELEFAREKEAPRYIRVEIRGPSDPFNVQSTGKAEYRGSIRPGPGWQRLSVEFSAESLRIFVDDLVLWSQAEGPGGQLRACRMVCEGMEVGEGEFRFDDFAIHAAALKSRPSLLPLDPTQDAVISRESDALYGSVTSIDPRGALLEGKFGKRRFPWTELSAIALRRLPVTPSSTVGEQVRLTLRTDDGGRDLLQGAVKALDEKAIVLGDLLLGELTLPLDRIDEIRPRFFGQEILVDAQPHHLGKRTSPRYLLAKPEGRTLSRKFRMDRQAETATLVVEACQVVGAADGKEVAASLQRTGMQTAVFINGKRIGCLNDLVDRSSPELKQLRLSIPSTMLALGENALEFQQTIDSETGAIADCEIRSIRIELTAAR